MSNVSKSKVLKIDIGVFKARMRQGEMDRKTRRKTDTGRERDRGEETYGQRQKGRHILRARRGGNRPRKPRKERHWNRSEMEEEKSEWGRHGACREILRSYKWKGC
jgi:hypothetical protein